MLPQLQAEQRLAAMEAASVPHMTARARTETFDRYQRALNAEQRPRRATLADLAAMGFRVHEVPKKKTTKAG